MAGILDILKFVYQLSEDQKAKKLLDQPSPFFPGSPGKPGTEASWQKPSIQVKPLETGPGGNFNLNFAPERWEGGLQNLGKSLTDSVDTGRTPGGGYEARIGAPTEGPNPAGDTYTEMQAQRAKTAHDAEEFSLRKKVADSQLKLDDMKLKQLRGPVPSSPVPASPPIPPMPPVGESPQPTTPLGQTLREESDRRHEEAFKPVRETGQRLDSIITDWISSLKEQMNKPTDVSAEGTSITGAPTPVMPNSVVDESYRGKQVTNPDGSFSSEKTITVGLGDKYYNIPTLINGVQVNPDEAVRLFKEGKIKAVGVASTLPEAVNLAGTRSNMLGQQKTTSSPSYNVSDGFTDLDMSGMPRKPSGVGMEPLDRERNWGAMFQGGQAPLPGSAQDNLQKIGKVFIDSGMRPYTPAPETANPVASGGSVPPSTYNVSDYGPGENPVGEQIASDPGTYIPGTPGVAARPGLTNRQLMEISKYKELGLISPEMLAKFGIREQEEFKPIPGRSPGMITKSGKVKPYEGLPQIAETTYFPSQEAALNAFVDKPGFQKFGKQTKYGWTVEYKAEPKPEKPEKPQKPYYEDTFDSTTGLTHRQEFMPDASGKWTVPTGKPRPVRGPKPVDKSTQVGMSDKELERKYVGAKNAWDTKKKGSLATMIAESEGKKVESPAHLKTFEAYKDWVRKGEPEVSTEKVLDESTATGILKEAGGDKNKAREIAKQRGYKF